MYEELDSMTFVNGYITVMAKESEHVKSRMLVHLQELMEDGEANGWDVVHSYHMVWLQHLVHGQAM